MKFYIKKTYQDLGGSFHSTDVFEFPNRLAADLWCDDSSCNDDDVFIDYEVVGPVEQS